MYTHSPIYALFYNYPYIPTYICLHNVLSMWVKREEVPTSSLEGVLKMLYCELSILLDLFNEGGS